MSSARRALVRARCAVGKIRTVQSTRILKGRVIKQSVRAGARVRRGTRIGLVVSRGR